MTSGGGKVGAVEMAGNGQPEMDILSAQIKKSTFRPFKRDIPKTQGYKKDERKRLGKDIPGDVVIFIRQNRFEDRKHIKK